MVHYNQILVECGGLVMMEEKIQETFTAQQLNVCIRMGGGAV